MIETFYEQIKVFGELIEQNKFYNIDTYRYNNSLIDVHLEKGKPIMIVVSK